MKGRLLLAVSTALTAYPALSSETCTPEVINGLLGAGADPVLLYRSCKLDPGAASRPAPHPTSNVPMPAGAPAKAVVAPPVPAPTYVPTPVAYIREERIAQASGDNKGTGNNQQGTQDSQHTDGDTVADTKQTDPLSKFSYSATNGSTLGTVHIATAYAPIRLSPLTEDASKVKKCEDVRERVKNTQKPRGDTFTWGVGVDVSSSLPTNSPTREDYGRHALNKLDGGVLNLYMSLVAHNALDCTFSPLASGDKANPRIKAWDHFYFLNTATPDTMLPYIKHALGVRGVKTSLEKAGGDANKDVGAYGGLGTYYLGLGVDGPLLNSFLKTDDPNAGWFTVEAFGTANRVNPSTLNSLFATTNAPHHFNTLGARATIGLPGRFYISAEYGKAYGSYGKEHIRDTSMLLFGYNNQSEPQNK